MSELKNQELPLLERTVKCDVHAPNEFDEWMDAVDAHGIKEGIFDAADTRFVCSGSHPRRPYRGTDGMFYELWASGVPVHFAIGEALAAE